MTLILELALAIVKMSHHTKNEVFMSRHSKVIARKDRQTHRQYENMTFSHTRAVMNEAGQLSFLSKLSKLTLEFFPNC